MCQCVKNTRGREKACACSKGIPEDVLEGAFVDAYNTLCKTHKTTFSALYDDIRKEFEDKDLDRLIQKNEKKLVDLKLNDGIDESTYDSAYKDMTGKIDAINMDIERLKADKLKMDDMQSRLASIETMVKGGNEITEFNRCLFDAMVEKVVAGEGDDPYKIKIFLKTKQKYEADASEYSLKKKAGRTINGKTYLQNADDPEKGNVCNQNNNIRKMPACLPLRNRANI